MPDRRVGANAAIMLARELFDTLQARGTRRTYERGAFVFGEGDTGDDVFGVVRGRVKVSAVTRDGREVVVAHKGPGEIFGELSAIDGLTRSATATALDHVTVVVVAGRDFVELVEDEPKFAIPLLHLLADNLRATTSDHTVLRAGPLPRRVAAGLVSIAEREGTRSADGAVTIRVRQDELAAWIGVNREAVSRTLGGFRAEDLVRTARGTIVLTDIAELYRRAGLSPTDFSDVNASGVLARTDT